MLQRPLGLHPAGEKADRPPHPESDTRRIVRQHLMDPNHVITEEDMHRIRIGSFFDEERTERRTG
jgi:hypothetical protein